MLDIQCFTYLHKALESRIAPIINFVTNRGAVFAQSLFTFKGLLIHDNHCRRILAHYYDPETLSTRQEQSSFERKLFRKTSKTNVEVLLHEGFPIVYK